MPRRLDAGQVWLVASISEALSRLQGVAGTADSSHASTRHPLCSGPRPAAVSFLVREGCTRCSAAQEPMQPVGSRMDFQLLNRQQQPIVSFLSLPLEVEMGVAGDALDDVAGLLNQHVFPRMGNALTLAGPMVAAQQHALQQLERAGRWVGLRRIWPPGHKEQRWPSSGGGSAGNACSQDASDASHHAEAERLSRLALQAQAQSNPELAAAIYSQLIDVQPTAEHYARLSKQLTDMTYMNGIRGVRERVVELNTKAVEVASLAVQLDASVPLAHIARCVSRGRLALVSDNRTKVQLAKEAADDAAFALRLDPQNDLAHHLMGRWHYEMAQLNAIARTLIRLIFGTALMQGSYSEALTHFQTAAELCPARVIHRVEVGRTLVKLGDKTGAMRELARCADMEIEDINAELQQQDAAIMLEQLRSHGVQGLWVTSPPSGQPAASRPPAAS